MSSNNSSMKEAMFSVISSSLQTNAVVPTNFVSVHEEGNLLPKFISKTKLFAIIIGCTKIVPFGNVSFRTVDNCFYEAIIESFSNADKVLFTDFLPSFSIAFTVHEDGEPLVSNIKVEHSPRIVVASFLSLLKCILSSDSSLFESVTESCFARFSDPRFCSIELEPSKKLQKLFDKALTLYSREATSEELLEICSLNR